MPKTIVLFLPPKKYTNNFFGLGYKKMGKSQKVWDGTVVIIYQEIMLQTNFFVSAILNRNRG